MQARSENEIKAVYLYNFIKFITWPQESASENINICIYGDNPFGAQTEKLSTLKARNRPLQIIYPDKTDRPDCSVVFISPSEEKFADELLNRINDHPVLTVSDIENFTNKGGVIGFIKLGNVVKFDINLKKARASNIQISSKLLELANQVIQ
ncbi:YfiR family protein [Alkalimarinus sediminis]|uniref:YfiR family protein n=1 Tax=Alkalimarinus sediminis TaxID=1632866 RepID=A0A9E8HIZ6_9ALTE|nr:YfiR family protein [Alkalimarinus sediminis]UZW75553.1 YfiR family protein [Alkalimarinus sediminis]